MVHKDFLQFLMKLELTTLLWTLAFVNFINFLPQSKHKLPLKEKLVKDI